MKKNFIKWLLPVLFVMQACSKSDVPGTPPTLPAKGLYVISEGNISQNNAKLGFYNISNSTFTGNYFAQQNPTQPQLGNTANDAIIYGSKLYIVMNASSQVVVLNREGGTLLKRIDFGSAASFKNPRYAVAAKGKVYVTSSDNTVSIIDTTALIIAGSITVGNNPEGIAAQGNYLYVANSGGFNFPNFDSTLSVIDINTSTEIKKIKVGLNPNKVEVAANGDVYVSAYGNFSTVPASISVINSTTNTLKSTLGSGYQYSHLRIIGNTAYFYNNYGGAGTAKVYNTTTNSDVRTEFITDGTTITTPYGVNIDEENGDVYIMDAKDYTTAGTVTCFSSQGIKKFSFSVSPGVSPNKVLFNR